MIEIRPSHGTVSAHFLHRAFLGCQKLGARKPVLLNALDIKESDLRNPQMRFHAESVSGLVSAARTEVRSPDLYHELGGAMLPSCFSDAGYSAMFERSFSDALRAALIAQDLGGDKIPYRFQENENSVFLVWEDPVSSPEFIQLVFSNIVRISQSLLPKKSKALKAIRFRHSKPSDISGYFGKMSDSDSIACSFNTDANVVEFDRNLFKAANARANPQVVYAASRRRNSFESWAMEPRSFSKLCYNYLVYLLDKSGLSLDSAAETFSMAERTLRRKLVAEDESFRHILERVRRDACQLYFVEGGRSLSEIAGKLGYSELSAFTRAYTAWYGHPPSRDLSAQTALAA